jgi:hypothetical protein
MGRMALILYPTSRGFLTIGGSSSLIRRDKMVTLFCIDEIATQ